MSATRDALRVAARMGARAGVQFRQTGVPSPCPVPNAGPTADVAAAWRRAYFAAIKAGRRRG